MPTLALVHNFSAGVLNAADWNDNLYDPTAVNGSFEIINGHLDTTNRDATDWPLILPEQVQRGAYGEMGFVAGTANLDYFNTWFTGLTVGGTSDTSTYPTRTIPIPGANATFYVQYPAMVVLSWTVFWTNISNDDEEQTRLHLFIDDVQQLDQRRDVRKVAASGTAYNRVHEGRRKNRYWSGHHTLELAKGWHTAGLRIVADPAMPQSRVWARSFRYIVFKKDATWG